MKGGGIFDTIKDKAKKAASYFVDTKHIPDNVPELDREYYKHIYHGLEWKFPPRNEEDEIFHL